ncbi:carbohydrate kinase family protein [Streptomyces sp. KM273126]|uniref:carbohydrate kinase family protein n=1 Tax=Streptomyces sp. KM273126 TaxID=2545247 RepID=UPI0014044639|nr:carbohydrate kinase family protein [Streptomyces sp. KM273126]MBA2807308.1 carbohydrate kinase family protein [Streptomyces sp. KM273126]
MDCAVVGGAYNVASAFRNLGDEPEICTLVGTDDAGEVIRAALRRRRLEGRGVVSTHESAKTLILVEPDGRVARCARATGGSLDYPMERFIERAVDADLAIITSQPFGEPFLHPAKELLGLPVAVDLHMAADLDDERQRPWYEAADVLFCSHERLLVTPEEWIRTVLSRYPGCRVAAVGRGERGCVMGLQDGRLVDIDAVTPRPVRSTDGAGDALFASFLHSWLVAGEAVEALESAVLFAGWKIGATSAAEGFLTTAELAALRRVYPLRTRVGTWRT